MSLALKKIERVGTLLKRRPTPVKLNWEEVFGAVGDGLIVLGPGGEILKMNPAAEKLVGQSAELVCGQRPSQAFPNNRDILRVIERLLRERRSHSIREIPWVMRHGEDLVLDLALSPMGAEDEAYAGWVLLLRDTTPVRKLEEEVRKRDHLASLGTLASGLAHEIKNPLGGIKGAAQLLARKANSPESRQCLDIIIKETTRVNQLVTDLLNLSRPRPLKQESININQLLHEILLLQEGMFAQCHIRTVHEFDPSLPAIQGDEGRLKQAFLNFFQNAIEAMPTGGTLRVSTRFQTGFLLRLGGKGSRLIRVEIKDTGVGIAPGDLEKIFIPFYTTKKKGTGLGMALAQGIIHGHEGTLRVSSTPGKGTNILVHLRIAS